MLEYWDSKKLKVLAKDMEQFSGKAKLHTQICLALYLCVFLSHYITSSGEGLLQKEKEYTKVNYGF